MAARNSPSKKMIKLPSNNSERLEAELTKNEPTISRKISVPLLSPLKLTRAHTRIPIRCKQHDKDAIQNSPGDFLTSTVAVLDSQHGHDFKENTEVLMTDVENATMIGFSQQPCGDHKSATVLERRPTVPVDSGCIDTEDSSKIVSEVPQCDQHDAVVNATTMAMHLNCSVSQEMKVFDLIDKSRSTIGCNGINVDSKVSFLSFLIQNPEHLKNDMKSENHDRRTVTFNEIDQLQTKNELCFEMKKQILAGMKSRDANFYKIMREGNERLDKIDKQLKGLESFRYGLILTLIVLPLCIMGLYFTVKYCIGCMESNKPLSWGDYCLEWWNSFRTPPKKHEWLMVCFSVLVGIGLHIFIL